MTTRRRFFIALTFALAGIFSPPALTAPPVVEIIAMPHPPVIRALKPLRDWIASQGGRLSLREIDAESTQGVKRLASIGLAGHIPVAILIDGSADYRHKHGKSVRFVNFPALQDSPPGARGNWRIEDARAAILERMNKP
jgi:hypothetical protein